ncbi:MAG: type IV secretory system conjugative DNA transfer family protein [Candidatus Andersenbacteria bacterium]|nr:type IV secretory system conjugative DNA transfer family protein [Candidatus Andersenbacteria bacterium]MBI3251132.1 type IV secretory system conjugative DNA transfer family protein [Candidatus Andersenbacteria bacterium]
MSLLLAFFLSFILAAVGTTIIFIIWQTLKEQARLRRTLDVAMLQVLLPKDIDKDRGEKEGEATDAVKEKISVGEQFLSTLSNLPTTWKDQLLYGQPIIVFEIIAKNDDTIVFYAGTERRYLDHLEKQIYAHYPDAEVTPAPDYTIFEEADNIRTGVLKLRRPEHLPIATYLELEADPMQALTGALAKIQNRDSAVVQYILQPAGEKARRKAGKAARRTVRGRQADIGSSGGLMHVAGGLMKDKEAKDRSRQEGSQLTGRMQQRVELTENKSAQQQFSVNIRIGVSCRQPEETERVFNSVAAAFSQYDMPDLNGLKLSVPKNNRTFLNDFIFRVPRPKGASTLSTTEIASLFHFPLPTTATPNILWRGAKTAPAPTDLGSEGVVLGTNLYRGIETPIHFAREDRRRHMYLIGQTGTGKTTMFLNMIVQDIKAGEGVGVVDPHGDLIEDILLHIPPERQQDVILFDPRDRDFPVGFNMLEVQDEAQKDLVVNEVVEILQKLAARLNPESIGPMFEHYLRNALLALVEDPNSTLIDVPRMFVDEPFRTQILTRLSNPVVKQFWEQEFKQSQRGQMSADMLSYVISKLGRFIGNETVRNLIGQAHSSFDVRKIMDEKKILLCNLSKGQLGDINSDLLGFVLVSKIQIAALGRANVPAEQRPDFYLYLDEFQNFTTDSIATILSEARKYRLNLNLTHQFVKQLDDKIKEAVFGNVGTIASYRIGVDDAEYLAEQFKPVFAEYDLLNLKRFTAVVRLLMNQTPQRPFSLAVASPPAGGDVEGREAVRALSRQKYGRNKADVEAEILERFKMGSPDKPVVAPPKGDYLGESLFDIG